MSMFPSQYQTLQRIARGGSAEVYRAVQSNAMGFERTVAIKRILPEHIGSEIHEAMLVNEAKLLVTLNHPNIVRVLDLGFRDGAYFFVMEYVDGCDLRSLMAWFQRQGQFMPLECTVLMGAELCKALDYAHSKKDASGSPLHLVHLDISPKNVLVSHGGEVKLTDFGIANFHSNQVLPLHPNAPSVSPERIVRGKYAYMSPEQALCKRVDHRSDLFSLGMVFYELLTGERLYRSDTLESLQNEHRQHSAHAPLFSNDIPEELEYIVLRCLQYDPRHRYGSAKDIYRDLLRFLFDSMGTIPHQQLAFMMEETLLDMRRHEEELHKETKQRTQEILPLDESTLRTLKESKPPPKTSKTFKPAKDQDSCPLASPEGHPAKTGRQGSEKEQETQTLGHRPKKRHSSQWTHLEPSPEMMEESPDEASMNMENDRQKPPPWDKFF